MMVNNSINNINKTNSHLSPLLIEYKKTLTYDVGYPGAVLGQEQKCASIYDIMQLFCE